MLISNFLTSSSTTVKSSQGVSDAINQAAEAGAAKRRAMAEQKLKMLGESLRMLMLFSATDHDGNQGYAKSAAFIAEELGGTVNDYAGTGGGSNQENVAFLAVATQLASQAKGIIADENYKIRRRNLYGNKHRKEINDMEEAIQQAAKALAQRRADAAPPPPIDITISSFAIAA